MEKGIQLSIVVPCYNEEKNMPLIVEKFKKAKPGKLNVELILVDNGSTDNSGKIIRKFAKENRNIKTVEIKKNIGYGNGISTGLKKASGVFVCWTHADLQTDIADTITAYKIAIKQKNPEKCFVKGKRKGRPFFDVFFTVGMSAFETLFLKSFLYDINAQPNLFHRDLLDKTKNCPDDFSFDLYFYYMAKKLNYKIVRFPVLFFKRIHGTSHWNTSLLDKWKFIKRTILFTFRLKKDLK